MARDGKKKFPTTDKMQKHIDSYKVEVQALKEERAELTKQIRELSQHIYVCKYHCDFADKVNWRF